MTRLAKIFPTQATWPLLLVTVCSCSSTPARVSAPDLDPASAASAAMRQYDTDGDGTLSPKELAAAGSIASGLAAIDTNGDAAVSEDELAASLEKLVAGGVGLTTFSCKVTLDGAPLSDAVVKLVPEPFMQDAILPAQGTTDASGVAGVALDASQLPSDQQNLKSVIHPGFYRVEITHPQTKIPAKYNSATTLGQLVSPETAMVGTAQFDLTSR